MKYLLFLIIGISMQSCFSIRDVSNENALRKQYLSKSVDDVEFKFGEPDEDVDLRDGGYAYTYRFKANVRRPGRTPVDQYIRFSFNDEGYVTNLISNSTVRRRRINVGATVVCAVGIPVTIFTALIIVAVSADSEY